MNLTRRDLFRRTALAAAAVVVGPVVVAEAQGFEFRTVEPLTEDDVGDELTIAEFNARIHETSAQALRAFYDAEYDRMAAPNRLTITRLVP